MTTSPFDITQVIVHRSATGPVIVARSEGISFEVEEFVLRTSVAFGTKPTGVTCSQAVFSLPVNDNTVAVGTLVDTGHDSLAFRFLFVSRFVYRVLGDTFLIADRFPVNITARGSLPLLAWPDEPPPERNVHDLQVILKAGDSALLLGGAQALIDGVAIRLARSQPEAKLIRDLWQFLPHKARAELYPAEYCFEDGQAFHASVLPSVPAKLPPGQLNEEQVKEYPEGRFELAMQVAIENGDQAGLDKLLNRRTSREMFRFTVGIILFAFTAMIVMRLIPW
ncbi:hypothetical protein BH11PLA2_BH11PLA2_09230 [soil metagenome]